MLLIIMTMLLLHNLPQMMLLLLVCHVHVLPQVMEHVGQILKVDPQNVMALAWTGVAYRRQRTLLGHF
jgi:hypothetical protein